MKKIISLFIGLFSVVLLVGCSNSTATSISDSSLDGEYYTVYKNKLGKSPWVIIEGRSFTYYFGGTEDSSGILRYSVDFDKQTLTGENEVISYSYKDGVLKAGIMSSSEEFIKKGSKIYEEYKKD